MWQGKSDLLDFWHKQHMDQSMAVGWDSELILVSDTLKAFFKMFQN